jgi:hypothetical protein
LGHFRDQPRICSPTLREVRDGIYPAREPLEQKLKRLPKLPVKPVSLVVFHVLPFVSWRFAKAVRFHFGSCCRNGGYIDNRRLAPTLVPRVADPAAIWLTSSWVVIGKACRNHFPFKFTQ